MIDHLYLYRKSYRDYIIIKKVLITRITGQDGSYLTEFLLNKEYVPYYILCVITFIAMGF